MDLAPSPQLSLAARIVTPSPASGDTLTVSRRHLQPRLGYGSVEEPPVPHCDCDAKILTIGEGTSEILRYVIARQMGLTE